MSETTISTLVNDCNEELSQNYMQWIADGEDYHQRLGELVSGWVPCMNNVLHDVLASDMSLGYGSDDIEFSSYDDLWSFLQAVIYERLYQEALSEFESLKFNLEDDCESLVVFLQEREDAQEKMEALLDEDKGDSQEYEDQEAIFNGADESFEIELASMGIDNTKQAFDILDSFGLW